MLLACSIAMFGNYYVFDALYPVTDALQSQLGFTHQDVGVLDTAYNVAALVALLGGVFLIDRLGTIRSAVLFAAIGALGTAGIAYGPELLSANPAWGMIGGRFVLGLGSELFIVAATTVVGRWFSGKTVATALAVQLLIGRLGSVVADKSPGLAKSLFTGWQPPLIAAMGLGLVWLVFAIIYALLEARAARVYGVSQGGTTDKLVLADILAFNRSYWWVVGLCVAFYATIFPFRTHANDYLIQVHGLTNEAAGNLKSLVPLISMFGMPLFGILVDRIGKRALLMTVGSFLLASSFPLIVYWHTGVAVPEIATPAFWFVPKFVLISAGTPLGLAITHCMLGLAFALVPAVLWPAVTYLVPEKRLGSAYALMTFLQQLLWGGMSWGIGAANDLAGASAAHPEGWRYAMWALSLLSLSAFVFSFLLWRDERGAHSHGLEARAPKQAA
ncbi:MAG: MFS transporter [Anaeromyxobacter sp.]